MKAEDDRTVDERQSVAPARRRKPGTFVKGDRRINRTLGPKPNAGGAGQPQLLRNMRRVARTSPSMDRTQIQRRLRMLFEENFPEFLTQPRQLEESLRTSKNRSGGNTVGNQNGDEAKRQKRRIQDDSRASFCGGDRIMMLFIPWANYLSLPGRPATLWMKNLPPDFQVIDGVEDRQRGGLCIKIRSIAFSLVQVGQPIPELRPEFGGVW
jgi:hypothetical protein